MDWLDIYLVGVVIAFAWTIFLLEVNKKDTAKYSLGTKMLFVILFSVFSWIYLIAMSANMLGQKFKR